MKKQRQKKIIIVDKSKRYSEKLANILLVEKIFVPELAENNEALFSLINSGKPDLILYDLFAGDEKFHLTMSKIHKVSPNTKVLVLSFEEHPALIEFCLTRGAAGFCTKSVQNPFIIVEQIKKLLSRQKPHQTSNAA
jgi:DNA-binding NarL/FixJ family response regulator